MPGSYTNTRVSRGFVLNQIHIPAQPRRLQDPGGLPGDIHHHQRSGESLHAPLGPQDDGDAGAVHKGQPAQIQQGFGGQVLLHAAVDGVHQALCGVVVQLAGKGDGQLPVFRFIVHLHSLSSSARKKMTASGSACSHYKFSGGGLFVERGRLGKFYFSAQGLHAPAGPPAGPHGGSQEADAIL